MYVSGYAVFAALPAVKLPDFAKKHKGGSIGHEKAPLVGRTGLT